MIAIFKKNIKYICTILVISIVSWICFFVFTPMKIDGFSMQPTLNDGDVIVVNKLNVKITRGDIIIFFHDGNKLVKRVIAIENDIVKIINSILYLNDEQIYELEEDVYSNITYFIDENEYFVVGDNLRNSHDSRNFGKVTKNDIIGKI